MAAKDGQELSQPGEPISITNFLWCHDVQLHLAWCTAEVIYTPQLSSSVISPTLALQCAAKSLSVELQQPCVNSSAAVWYLRNMLQDPVHLSFSSYVVSAAIHQVIQRCRLILWCSVAGLPWRCGTSLQSLPLNSWTRECRYRCALLFCDAARFWMEQSR